MSTTNSALHIGKDGIKNANTHMQTGKHRHFGCKFLQFGYYHRPIHPAAAKVRLLPSSNSNNIGRVARAEIIQSVGNANPLKLCFSLAEGIGLQVLLLIALCYGRPSREKLLLKIHTLARKPYGNPLAGHILDIILFAAGLYADLLGSAEIWLVEPMNEALVATYERYGYCAQRNKLGKVTHLSMRLNDEA